MNHHGPFYLWLCRHRAASFLLLTASFIGFGALSLDLVRLFSANSTFLLVHGWQAMLDGGLLQLFELLVSALLAMGAYLLFKLCEHALVHRLIEANGRRV